MSATVHPWSEPQLELSEMFPRQDEQVHSTVLDGESVLLNLKSGRYYTLNVVGSTIWNLCRGGLRRCEMIEYLRKPGIEGR